MNDAEREWYISIGWMQALNWLMELEGDSKEHLTLESLKRLVEIEAGIRKRKMLACGKEQYEEAMGKP